MYLAHTRAVPASEIPHVVVYKEVVGLHIVCPTVQFVITPAIPLAMNDKARDKEFFK